jgi:hypothetical protein
VNPGPWVQCALACFFFGLLLWFRYESTREPGGPVLDRRFLLVYLPGCMLFSAVAGVITAAFAEGMR